MSNSQLLCIYLKKYKQLFVKEIYFSKKYLDDKDPENNLKNNLVRYQSLISNCQECQLSKARKNFVFGSGDPNADLVLVGEAPGLDEDNQGVPFVGKSWTASGQNFTCN